jgi:hypothetical protein
VFAYERDGAAVLGDLASALEAGGWPVERDGGAVATHRGELRVIASADGATVLVDAITAAPPADARGPRPPPLTKPPAGYPPGFPFIPGGIAQTLPRAPAKAIQLVYPGKTAAMLATALRRGAERQQWMCTQEKRAFVCASAGRSVDVRLGDRRGEATLMLIASP